MSFCLSASDLVEITHKKKPSAQSKALRSMGIDFVTRPDGTLMVLPKTTFDRVKSKAQTEEKRPQMGYVR